jgi:hypothetical protein
MSCIIYFCDAVSPRNAPQIHAEEKMVVSPPVGEEEGRG